MVELGVICQEGFCVCYTRAMISRWHILGLACTGLLSGSLSFFLNYTYLQAHPLSSIIYTEELAVAGNIYWLTGLLFGLFVGSYFCIIFGKNASILIELIKFIAISTFSSIAAWYIAQMFFWLTPINLSLASAGGALAIYFGVQFSFIKISDKYINRYLLAAGIIGVVYYLGSLFPLHSLTIGLKDDYKAFSGLLYLLIAWQTGIAGLLGWMAAEPFRTDAKASSLPQKEVKDNSQNNT